MAFIRGFKLRCQRVHYDLDTRREFLLQYIDRLAAKCLGKETRLYINAHVKRLAKAFRRGDIYLIRDVKMPVINSEYEQLLFTGIYEDTFKVYMEFGDDYSKEIFDMLDKVLPEGAYGLIDDKVNVTVKSGDIVIDAGSWAGDFAAYASVKGAHVYAFEPTPSTFEMLKKTAELNGNIIPVKKGLSDENTSAQFFITLGSHSGANSISVSANSEGSRDASLSVETTTIDDFVRENHLPRVDFIKSDIEGFERHMLAGAQDTLARFAPKLALCTYHLPDDPQVMAELILKANPKYNIVQKRKKLFASVP